MKVSEYTKIYMAHFQPLLVYFISYLLHRFVGGGGGIYLQCKTINNDMDGELVE